jgi:hypothetical protein
MAQKAEGGVSKSVIKWRLISMASAAWRNVSGNEK